MGLREGFVLFVGVAPEQAEELTLALHERRPVVILPDLEAARAWLVDTDGSEDRRVVGSLEVDVHGHIVTADGERLALTEHEFQILSCLAERPGWMCTFRDLHESGWDEPFRGDRTMVKAAIKRLRRKLSSACVPVQIEAVRGVGVRLVGEVPR